MKYFHVGQISPLAEIIMYRQILGINNDLLDTWKTKKILTVDSSKALVRIFWSSRRHMDLSELYEGSKCQNFNFYVQYIHIFMITILHYTDIEYSLFPCYASFIISWFPTCRFAEFCQVTWNTILFLVFVIEVLSDLDYIIQTNWISAF